MGRSPGRFASPAAMTLVRLLLGAIFLASGLGKLLEPAGQFAHILEAYRLVPELAIPLIAKWLPWVELLLGAYLVAGFESRWAGSASAFLFVVFSAAIATNLAIGAPLEDCGCFGVLLKKEGATLTLAGDLLMMGLSFWLAKNPSSRASLDGWLEAKGW